jgi:AcrR family transcriptional regulator
MFDEKYEQLCPASGKIEKIYKAVGELVEEGRDINILTVSEITEKAGIGKGTAYEYFKSKEEMIAKSILYEMMKSLNEIERRIESRELLREKYMTVLEWLEEIYEGRCSGAVFCQIVQSSFQLSKALKKEVDQYFSGPESVFESIACLVGKGMEHGQLQSVLPKKLRNGMVLSSFMSYWVYINQKPENEEEKEQVRDILYRCLEQNLEMKI